MVKLLRKKKAKASVKYVLAPKQSARTGMRNRVKRAIRSAPALMNKLITSKGPMSVVNVPASEGAVIPRSGYGFNGAAQALADYDNTRSLKMRGNGLFAFDVINRSTQTAAWGFSAVPGGAARFWVAINPIVIDLRLQDIALTFNFYAIRNLRMTYIPQVGSQTQGSIALGMSTNALDTALLPQPSQQQALEFNHSVLFPVWQTTTMDYTHRGTKTWRVDENFGTLEQSYQIACCAVQSSPVASALTYGKFYVEYEVDFYEPVPTGANPNLVLKSFDAANPDRLHRDEDHIGQLTETCRPRPLPAGIHFVEPCPVECEPDLESKEPTRDGQITALSEQVKSLAHELEKLSCLASLH